MFFILLSTVEGSLSFLWSKRSNNKARCLILNGPLRITTSSGLWVKHNHLENEETCFLKKTILKQFYMQVLKLFAKL